MKTVRRDWLKKQVAAGKMEARCNIHLTDDYRFDNSINFGKTDWMPARLKCPKFENINGTNRCVDSDFVDGAMNLMSCDFEGNSGSAYWSKENELIHLRVHSNLNYTLRFKA